MKFLKRFFIFLLLVLIAGAIYIFTYSGKYDITRTKTIKAPISHVFNTVNDLKTWEKWGPWHDQDSTIVVTYGDKTVGVGASDSWTSKDGPGKMETVAIENNKSIDQKISFMDNEPSDIYWKFKEVEGGTDVTWGMKAEDSPFMFKFFAAISGGWDAMFGPMEDDGLNNLAAYAESTIPAPSFTIGKVSETELPAGTFIGYPHKIKINHAEMTKLFMQDMPKAGIYAATNGLVFGDYTPGAVYSKYDEASNETEFYIGLLLHKKLKPAEGMELVNIPSGKAVRVKKCGNYGDGDLEAHMAIDAYLKNNNLKKKYPIWELYVNDPADVKPEDIQTDIYYPIEE